MTAALTFTLAFLVGFLDFMICFLTRPRRRNAFLGFFRLRVYFVVWGVLFGLMSISATVIVLWLVSLVGGGNAFVGQGAPLAAVLVPIGMTHLALAWPTRGEFGAADQRHRIVYPFRAVWNLAGRATETQYSHCLERMAHDYASVPWDDTSLARIHARIVPHYRSIQVKKRVNPRLLTTLKTFREQEDVFAFFYAILEEFGPREVNDLLARL